MSNKFEALKHHTESDSSGDGGDNEETCNAAQNMDLGAIEYPHTEHRLQHPYCMWYSKRNNYNNNLARYSQALQLVGQVGTVEQWWALYSHTIRLQDLSPPIDLHLFKKGIHPMWEDSGNIKGGKWVVKMRKGHVGRAWENLCMAMLGEQFMAGNEVCGVVVSVRYQEDYLSIWNRTATDQITIARIRDALKRLLNLPLSATMEYKTHNDSLKAMKTIPHNPKVVPTSTK